MARFFNLFDLVLEAMGFVAAVLLGLMALGITAEILVRGFNLGSLPWMIEIVEYSLLAVTFLGAPWVLRLSAHVSVDIVVEYISPRSRRRAELAANAIGILVCGVIFYYGLKSTIELYNLDTKIYKIMTVKEWWLFALVPVSCAMMLVEFVRRFVRRGEPQDDEASDNPEASL
jgi:TRAP-type C4-dicarboxylate transport system permease small subunit